MAMRVQNTTRAIFVALHFRDSCKEFGGNLSKGFCHQREVAKLVSCWWTAKIQSETELKADAVARRHWEPVQTLTADWISLMANSMAGAASVLATQTVAF